MKRAILLAACVACGSTEKPSSTARAGVTTTGDTAASSAPSASPTPSAEAPHTLPTGCASNDPCVPEPIFVKRLCDGSFPDVALRLMSKSMPFTHAYLRGDVDGWNAEGGASARAKLKFDEEVLVLKKRSGNTSGIQVSGTGGYLVMRWDGNCYTLADDEITTHHPPSAKWAPVTWRYLAPATKDALLGNASVKTAYDKRGHECKGATSGDVTLACQKADEALAAAVVAAVRGGVAIPTPERIP